MQLFAADYFSRPNFQMHFDAGVLRTYPAAPASSASMANSVDPNQTAPIGAVCSGSTLFASILYSSVMLDSYLQQMIFADDIFRCIFFLGALRVKLII